MQMFLDIIRGAFIAVCSQISASQAQSKGQGKFLLDSLLSFERLRGNDWQNFLEDW